MTEMVISCYLLMHHTFLARRGSFQWVQSCLVLTVQETAREIMHTIRFNPPPFSLKTCVHVHLVLSDKEITSSDTAILRLTVTVLSVFLYFRLKFI